MDAKAKMKKIIAAYKKQGARVETRARVKLKAKKDFSLWYTPGVGVASMHLAKHPGNARKMSVKRNSVAVISDGSAVLGLGNIGPYGTLPVMEGKALIFKEMAGIDAWPIVLDTQDPDEIVRTVKAIAPASPAEGYSKPSTWREWRHAASSSRSRIRTRRFYRM